MRRFLLSEPLLATLCAVLLLVAGYAGVRLGKSRALDELATTPGTIEVTEGARPELVFSAAKRTDELGDYQQALSLYSTLQQTKDPQLQAAVRYNMATIYLREAARTWDAVGVLEHARVSTLLELAKENYRAVLRIDPEDWDARFNLEYADRIKPPPKERPKADFQGTKSSVFSTLPSLPGGGP